VKRIPRIGPVCVIAAAAIVAGGALAFGCGPILFHAFGERDCACGDFHDKVTGLAIWNPFRDRSPEHTANDFLFSLRANECLVGRELCDYALPGHRVSDWKVMNREDRGDSVTLYLKLTKYGVSDLRYGLTGEGMIRLRKGAAGWRVANYSSYF
jgi:hypothetical protein